MSQIWLEHGGRAGPWLSEALLVKASAGSTGEKRNRWRMSLCLMKCDNPHAWETARRGPAEAGLCSDGSVDCGAYGWPAAGQVALTSAPLAPNHCNDSPQHPEPRWNNIIRTCKRWRPPCPSPAQKSESPSWPVGSKAGPVSISEPGKTVRARVWELVGVTDKLNRMFQVKYTSLKVTWLWMQLNLMLHEINCDKCWKQAQIKAWRLFGFCFLCLAWR